MSKISLLQTGDWHIDVAPSKAPRNEDHRHFLKWMLKLMREQQTEVLLHTGNIFHSSLPSHQGLLLLNDFIYEATKLPELKSMIFISGNHDPSQLMQSLTPLVRATDQVDVRFISQQPEAEHPTEDRFLISVGTPGTKVTRACIVALPYIPHPVLLSRYASDKKSAIDRFLDVQKALRITYTTLAEQARSKHPQAPIIALGHFHCRDEETFPTALTSHRSIYFNRTFTPELFCQNYDYVALGHNQNVLSLDDGRIQYSGSPVTTSEEECSSRYVLKIEIGASKKPQITRIEVPPFRSTISFEGSSLELLELLDQLSETQTAYLYATITQSTSHKELLKAIDNHTAPVRLIDLKHLEEKRYLNTDTSVPMMNPEQIFSEIYTQKYGSEPSQALLDLLKKASENAHAESTLSTATHSRIK